MPPTESAFLTNSDTTPDLWFGGKRHNTPLGPGGGAVVQSDRTEKKNPCPPAELKEFKAL